MNSAMRHYQFLNLILAGYLYLQLRKKKRVRTVGVREIFRRRTQFGDGHNLLEELRFRDPLFFFIYTRMNVERFEYLLSLVGPLIKKREMYTALSPTQRLAMTLRFLAAGDSQYSLSFSYRCGQSTVSQILAETTRALVSVLKSVFVNLPANEAEWREVSAGFWEEWQFPHCVGAIDGKHVQVQAPQASQSVYLNYKKTFSMVLLAVCDAHYNFIMLDVGAEGSQSDGGVFQSSEMGRRLNDGSLNLPNSSHLPGTDVDMPYFLVGDAAFPLKPFLMKPYGERNIPHDKSVYNFRLSRARRVIENAFGILAARWRIFRHSIIATEDNVESIIECAVCLHNFIRKTGDRKLNLQYCPLSFVDQELPTGELVEGEWRDIVAGENGAIIDGPRMGVRNAALGILQQRDTLKEFVNGPGAMRHQDDIVRIRQGIIPFQ
ncbi:putative nuclease HARBI1 [Temnothorax longispinosus]|uniref:putative nuclease HARBI1 n=1 Tax=Temnothorax longispinosus TaxID=300112 RepID=UPI003A99BAA6